jgi:glc operon protein GlcG
MAHQRPNRSSKLMRTKSTIDTADADQICQSCLDDASAVGVSVSIAVVDEGGGLLRFVRMNPARGHTVDLALRKARSAASAAVSTKAIDTAIRAGKLTNVESIGWGGVPIHANGECVGAIGVSGASSEVDDELAIRAAAAFTDQLNDVT